MGLGLGLNVGKDDFVKAIEKLDLKMSSLEDVIEKYRKAKVNLDQFVKPEDSSYESWVQRIDEHIAAAGKARALLKEQKDVLQQTVDQMEGIGKEIRETVEAGAEAVKSTTSAAIKIAPLL